MTRKGTLASALALFLVFLWTGTTVSAQNVTGTILGTVSDKTGAVLPGVTLTIRNTGTGQERVVVTDGQGRYREPQLSIGFYDIKAELQGFGPQVRQHIELTIASELVINFSLDVGGVQETLIVTAQAPIVQTTSSEVSALVDQQMIQQLPLNARDIQQLATLQPGVQSQSAYNGLYGANISVRGSRPEQNRYLLNGVDTSTTFGTSPVSAANIIMGVEGLHEFRVMTSDYSAAYGVKQGGVVNMVTKAGTNEFRGSAYEFHRDDKLDGVGIFEKASFGKAPLKRDQFGFSLGGPIVQDKVHFFSNYEQYRSRITTVGGAQLVPSEQARAGFWPDASGNMVFLGIAPQMKGYLDLIPHGNGVQRSDGYAEYFSNPNQVIDERYITGRVDYQISATNQLWGVYTGDWSLSTTPNANQNFALMSTRDKQIYSVENVHTFSNRLINSTRVGVNRNYYFDEATAVVPVDPSLYVAQDPFSTPSDRGQFPSISIGQMIGMASGGNAPVWYTHTGISFDTEFNYTKGANSWKFGGNWSHARDDGSFTAVQVRGEITFNLFSDFMKGIANTANVLLPGSNPDKNFRSDLASAFVEDNWRPSQHVTITAGLRWDGLLKLDEAKGQIANLRGTCCPVMVAKPTVGNPVLVAQKTNFAPRVGFNWDVTGDGKTSLRGGGGLFYNQINPFSLRESSNNVPITTQVSLNNVPFPNVWTGYSPTTTPPDFGAIEYNPKTPVLYSYHATLQRELPGRISVTASYVGSQGRHLPSGTIVNSDWGNRLVPTVLADGTFFWPAGLTRPNPNFGRIGFGEFVLTSQYNALQLAVDRRMSSGFAFTANYTYSDCVDDASGELNTALGNGGGPGVLQTSFDLRSGRGKCSFTSTHSANFTTTWELPGQELKGALGAVVGGWRWSTITTVQSGYPFNVTTGRNQSRQSPTTAALGDRPDFAPGCDQSKIVTGQVPTSGNLNALWFDPTCFVLNQPGFLGHVPARFLTGPGLFTSDWSLAKNFTFNGGKRIEIQAQAFNITNQMNFRVPSAAIFTTSGARSPNAGKITALVTPARQVQLGLKFVF